MPDEVKRLWPSAVDTIFGPEIPVSAVQARADVVQAQVRNSLENILNSRLSPVSVPPHLGQVRKSIRVFGIPDFTAYGFDNFEQRKELCHAIREAILSSEPRLTKVRVEDQNTSENLSRQLQFRISGDLQIYPEARAVSYDSRLDRATYVFRVIGR